MACTACLIHWFTYLFLVRYLSQHSWFLRMIRKCHCLQIIPFVQLYAGLFSNHSPLYFTNTKRFFSKMGLACHIAKIHSEVIELKGGMQVFFFFLVLGFILASYYVLKQLLLVLVFCTVIPFTYHLLCLGVSREQCVGTETIH